MVSKCSCSILRVKTPNLQYKWGLSYVLTALEGYIQQCLGDIYLDVLLVCVLLAILGEGGGGMYTNIAWQPAHSLWYVIEGTFARRTQHPNQWFGHLSQCFYPCHTKLGVPFSPLQKHNSLMHAWKQRWQGSVIAIFTSLGIIACSLGDQNKCPDHIVLG